jgi:hypothetical protein
MYKLPKYTIHLKAKFLGPDVEELKKDNTYKIKATQFQDNTMELLYCSSDNDAFSDQKVISMQYGSLKDLLDQWEVHPEWANRMRQFNDATTFFSKKQPPKYVFSEKKFFFLFIIIGLTLSQLVSIWNIMWWKVGILYFIGVVAGYYISKREKFQSSVTITDVLTNMKEQLQQAQTTEPLTTDQILNYFDTNIEYCKRRQL